MDFTLNFFQLFLFGLYLAATVLLLLMAMVVVLGQIAGRGERWPALETLYWSFITATTVGYGEISPARRLPRILAVLIAFTGIIFTGIIVAVAVYATTESLRAHSDATAIRSKVEQIVKE